MTRPLAARGRLSMREQQYGKYLLLDRIAVGGMAEIFLARQMGPEGFEKTVVVKRIRPHLGDKKSFVRMFLNEAKLAAQLTHPNIIQIHDLGKVGDSYFIAMEYLFGRDMRRVLPSTEAASARRSREAEPACPERGRDARVQSAGS
jgi:serine/threonine protein kinase